MFTIILAWINAKYKAGYWNLFIFTIILDIGIAMYSLVLGINNF